MKKRYENDEVIIIFSFIFIICLIGVGFIVYNLKICSYKNFSGVVENNNLIELVLSDEELKLFNKNQSIYIKDKKIKFSISKVLEDILERDGSNFNQVYIEVNLSNMYKVNDVVDIAILVKKESLINIFKVIWEGD